MQNFTLHLLLACLLLLTGCGEENEPPPFNARPLPTFHALRIDFPGKVILHTGDDHRAELRNPQNNFQDIHFDRIGDLLFIHHSGSIAQFIDKEIHLTFQRLDILELHGSGDVQAYNLLSGDHLDLTLLGSGDLLLNQIFFNTTDLTLEGNGHATLIGNAGHLEAHVSGSGDLYAKNFTVNTANIFLASHTDIYCHVLELLTATVSGSGTIWYRGNPTLNLHISGTGEVIPL